MQTHTIQAGTPPTNIALFGDEFGKFNSVQRTRNAQETNAQTAHQIFFRGTEMGDGKRQVTVKGRTVTVSSDPRLGQRDIRLKMKEVGI